MLRLTANKWPLEVSKRCKSRVTKRAFFCTAAVDLTDSPPPPLCASLLDMTPDAPETSFSGLKPQLILKLGFPRLKLTKTFFPQNQGVKLANSRVRSPPFFCTAQFTLVISTGYDTMLVSACLRSTQPTSRETLTDCGEAEICRNNRKVLKPPKSSLKYGGQWLLFEKKNCKNWTPQTSNVDITQVNFENFNDFMQNLQK